ncbi:hypothetical protein Syun_030086 [Stephania yunnanensis]|uniref:Uncharacterized protein n=1 Tax=Stephania yunnanensis TaxID=152371 RepID=A0AAP0EBC8_9MAGN
MVCGREKEKKMKPPPRRKDITREYSLSAIKLRAVEQLWFGKVHVPRVSRVRGGAPQYWQNIDPSWIGTGPPMHRYFHLDGRQTADPDDKAWGGHECNYSIETTFVDGGRIRQNYIHAVFSKSLMAIK